MKISDNQLLAEYRKRFIIPTGDKLYGSGAAAHHAHSFLSELDSHREYFGMIYINGANEVVDTEIVAWGTLTTATVYPREVVKSVLNNGSAAVILFHNHPSGNLTPSKDDLSLTYRLRDALSLIDVKVHDHLILIPDPAAYYSFAEGGDI